MRTTVTRSVSEDNASSSVTPGANWTLADILRELGGIPPHRVRAFPPPGTAALADLESVRAASHRICELIDGALVEKTVGWLESRLAIVLAHLLESYLDQHDLGIVLGEAGTLEILPNQVRAPDVAFLSWDRFPDRRFPQEPVPRLVPDLAVEILSQGNTDAEMQRKLRDYFAAGVRLVWIVDPRARSARVFESPERGVALAEHELLVGGSVLPGFQLSIQELFARAERRREPL